MMRRRVYVGNVLFACALTLLPGLVAAEEWRLVNGHRLFFQRLGSGPPLVLLHGGGSTPEDSFAGQLHVLAAKHRVIAPEQVGHGHTPDIAGDYSYTAMMDDTVKLMDRLGIKQADFVGWSDGGILALMIAIHHPRYARRLVVSGVNVSPDGVIEGEDADEAVALPGQGDMPGVALTTLPYVTSHGPSFDAKLDALWRSSPTGRELNFELLGRVKQPVLVMAGQYDVIRLAHTLSIYHALPAAELFIVEGAGHGTFVESPAAVNRRMLAFLDAK